MRQLLYSVCLLLAAVCSANAQHIVVPYDCTPNSSLSPTSTTEPHKFPIIGQRQTQTLNVCASDGSGQCRQLVIHKFNIDCRGQQVAWRDMAERIMRERRIAYSVSNWELAFRVGKGGFAAFNAMCDGTSNDGASRSPALQEACRADASTPPADVRLPEGFAPVREFGGRIEASVQSTVARLSPISSAQASEPQGDRNAAIALPGELPAQDKPGRSVEQGQPQTSEKPDAKSVAGTVVPARGGLKAEPQAVTLAAAGKAAVQTAKNWTTSIVETTSGTKIGADNVQQSKVATILGLALITSLLSGIGWFATQQLMGSRSRSADPYQVILRREVTDLAKPDAQMCGELCRTGQNLIGDIHTRVEDIKGAAPLRRVLLREVRSMEQFLATTVGNAPDDPREWRRMRLRLQRVVTDLIRLKDITDGARRSLTSRIISDELPRDKQEAYEVLGANPEASEKILKRLVDALRATWHPDLAANDDDRALRDRRIKQINVAWDLISEKRLEV